MRIISGTHKGMRIIAPKNLPVRPTTDQAKESLFNILSNQYDLDEITVLDLFSGTGNMSYEFLSRGAKKVISVDANFHCFKFQQKMKKEFQFDNFFPFRNDVFKAINKVNEAFDIIFADPPYDLGKFQELCDKLVQEHRIKPGGIIIIEHGKDTELEHKNLSEVRKYGAVNFSIFRFNSL